MEKKIDDTKTTVEEVKEELAEVKDRLQYTTGLLEAVYRRDEMRRHNSLGLPTPPKKRQRIPIRGHRWKRMMLPLGSCCLYWMQTPNKKPTCY